MVKNAIKKYNIIKLGTASYELYYLPFFDWSSEEKGSRNRAFALGTCVDLSHSRCYN